MLVQTDGKVILSDALFWSRRFPSSLNKNTEKARCRIPFGLVWSNLWLLYLLSWPMIMSFSSTTMHSSLFMRSCWDIPSPQKDVGAQSCRRVRTLLLTTKDCFEGDFTSFAAFSHDTAIFEWKSLTTGLILEPWCSACTEYKRAMSKITNFNITEHPSRQKSRATPGLQRVVSEL